MKYRLANGNTIAKTVQPLQNKDFDRIEITDDYDGTPLSDYFNSDSGEVEIHPGEIEFTVKLYNPSTHLIRKSHHKYGIILGFGPCTQGHVRRMLGFKLSIYWIKTL